MKPHRVFISHSRVNKDIAREIAFYLVTENIEVWFDEWKICVGDSIVGAISQGLTTCSHIILLWSKEASESAWVKREAWSAISNAIQGGSPRVIPILLDNTKLPEILSDIRYARLQGDKEKDRRTIILAITGLEPVENFAMALVRKYREIAAEPENFLETIVCPKCGSMRLKRSSALDERYDEVYYVIECEECGWVDWVC